MFELAGLIKHFHEPKENGTGGQASYGRFSVKYKYDA